MVTVTVWTVVMFAAGVLVGGHNAETAERVRVKAAAAWGEVVAWLKARLGGGA